jgi:ATP-dependent helicase/nuclease subunit B
MGSLLHSILYEFYKTISREKIILSGCSDEVFNRAIDIMFKIALEKTGMVNLDFPLAFFEKEKILGINNNRKQSVLYKFVEKEREIESKFTPAYFEIPFGGVRNEEGKYEYKSLVDFKVGDVEVRGKIDRIDIDKDDNSFKLIDYKLGGKTPVKDDLKQGLSLQLPLYLHAAQKLLTEEKGKNLDPAVAEIYSLKMKESDFGPKVVKISDTRKNYETADEKTRQELVESNKEMIKICLDKITKYVSSIAGGEFNLSTLPDRKEKVCKYCDFAGICRVNEFEE